MNDRTEILKTTYTPELSIVVYRSEEDTYYLESHSISKSGQVLEGKPLRQETINSIVEMFFANRKESTNIGGVIPENLLLFNQLPGGHYKMIWYRLPEQRVLHFADQLHIRTGKAPVPGVIYVAEKNSLTVFAFKGNKRPVDGTKLFRSPFHNVGDNGKVCLGSANVKKPAVKSFANVQKYWEDLFWLSEFTHLNGASNPTKSDLGKVWRKLINGKGKIKWSSLDELKPTDKSLKVLLK